MIPNKKKEKERGNVLPLAHIPELIKSPSMFCTAFQQRLNQTGTQAKFLKMSDGQRGLFYHLILHEEAWWEGRSKDT